jgi:hypothetical protein
MYFSPDPMAFVSWNILDMSTFNIPSFSLGDDGLGGLLNYKHGPDISVAFVNSVTT